jgi:NADPH-dependent 2,4-dienoyl-CoA reductase/sulfur reductase-like enzyme
LRDIKLDVLSNLKANLIHAAVTSLSAKEKEVVLDNGSRIRFDKALLATGGKPKRLSIPGADGIVQEGAGWQKLIPTPWRLSVSARAPGTYPEDQGTAHARP